MRKHSYGNLPDAQFVRAVGDELRHPYRLIAELAEFVPARVFLSLKMHRLFLIHWPHVSENFGYVQLPWSRYADLTDRDYIIPMDLAYRVRAHIKKEVWPALYGTGDFERSYFVDGKRPVDFQDYLRELQRAVGVVIRDDDR